MGIIHYCGAYQMEALSLQIVPCLWNPTLKGRCQYPRDCPKHDEDSKSESKAAIERCRCQVANEHQESKLRTTHAGDEEDIGGILRLSPQFFISGKIERNTAEHSCVLLRIMACLHHHPLASFRESGQVLPQSTLRSH